MGADVAENNLAYDLTRKTSGTVRQRKVSACDEGGPVGK
jgi:hypothetical protein